MARRRNRNKKPAGTPAKPQQPIVLTEEEQWEKDYEAEMLEGESSPESGNPPKAPASRPPGNQDPDDEGDEDEEFDDGLIEIPDDNDYEDEDPDDLDEEDEDPDEEDEDDGELERKVAELESKLSRTLDALQTANDKIEMLQKQAKKAAKAATKKERPAIFDEIPELQEALEYATGKKLDQVDSDDDDDDEAPTKPAPRGAPLPGSPEFPAWWADKVTAVHKDLNDLLSDKLFDRMVRRRKDAVGGVRWSNPAIAVMEIEKVKKAYKKALQDKESRRASMRVPGGDGGRPGEGRRRKEPKGYDDVMSESPDEFNARLNKIMNR